MWFIYINILKDQNKNTQKINKHPNKQTNKNKIKQTSKTTKKKQQQHNNKYRAERRWENIFYTIQNIIVVWNYNLYQIDVLQNIQFHTTCVNNVINGTW